MVEIYPSYVKIPTSCKIVKLGNTTISSRRVLNAELDNLFEKKILFILMNPSKADNNISDKTINKCAHISYHDLKKLKIGYFSVVNVYPFYEAYSSKLQSTLVAVQSASKSFYYKEIIKNLEVISLEIVKADYIFLCTGGIPKEIIDINEYQFLINTIHSYVETNKGTVFLGKGDKNKDYLKKENILITFVRTVTPKP